MVDFQKAMREEKAARLGLETRFHHGSWWVYSAEHDSNTGPYSTEQQAADWIDGILEI